MRGHLTLLLLIILSVAAGCSYLNQGENSDVDASLQTPQGEDIPSSDLVESDTDSSGFDTDTADEIKDPFADVVSGTAEVPETSASSDVTALNTVKSPYKLNVGDIIEISLLDEPEMTRDISVMPDGTITYLLVGELSAEGKTITELRRDLTDKLDEFFVSPYVSIISKKINLPVEEEKRVSILGAIQRSGNYTWNKGDRVLDLIAQAGGLLYTQTELGSRTTANLKASYLSRNGDGIDVDFYKLLRLGDMRYNIELKPGDFIYIADSEESTIIVMGEVYKPRIIPYTRDFSIVEALSICGGFTREAYQSRVVILRTTDGETKYVEVDVNDLLHGKNVKNLMLEGGDIVYVPEQTLSEYARWAGFLVDIGNLIIKGYEVKDAIRFPHLSRDSGGFP